jgi:hypothetical protein
METSSVEDRAVPQEINEALRLLDDMGDREVADHPAVFDRIHSLLRSALQEPSDQEA